MNSPLHAENLEHNLELIFSLIFPFLSQFLLLSLFQFLHNFGFWINLGFLALRQQTLKKVKKRFTFKMQQITLGYFVVILFEKRKQYLLLLGNFIQDL